MSNRKQLWIEYAGEELGELTEPEKKLAKAAAEILDIDVKGLGLKAVRDYEAEAAAAVVTVVEAVRAVASGNLKSFGRVL